jgi:ribosomal protein S18 acetylase RimI-like enzyme
MEPLFELGIGQVMLRPYNARNDAHSIARLVGQIWHGGGDALMEGRFGLIADKPWGHWQSQSILNYLAAPDCRAFVAVESNELVGFCSYVLDIQRRLGTVGYNGVSPDHQGRRIGSAMISFVMDQLRKADMEYAAVLVATNPQHAPARRVYENHGFEHLMGLDYRVRKL